MQILRDWTAKRAGGRITITAVDDKTAQVVKIVGVDRIFPTALGVVAQDKNGVQYRLSVLGDAS